MKWKTFTLAALMLGLVSMVSAQTQVQVDPLNETVLAQNVNGSVTTNELPFTVEKKNGDLVTNVSLDFPPQVYTGTVTTDGNYSEEFKVNVSAYRSYNVNPGMVVGNVSVGSSGRLESLNIDLNSNVRREDIAVSVSGNASGFLSVVPGFTVYRDFDSSVDLGFSVPRSQRFGYYRSSLVLTGDSLNRTIPVKLTLVDDINPEITNSSVNGFEATQPVNFTIKTSDNLEVESVGAEVVRERSNPDPNKTGLINQTVENLEFKKNQGNVWSAVPKGGKPGQHYLKLTVRDSAGNTVQKTFAYTVTGLSAINLDSQVELPSYRKGETIQYVIGNVSADTKSEFTLESFSRNLQNTSLAVEVEGDRRFFNSVNQTLSFDHPGQVKLVVIGDRLGNFHGRIGVQGVEQHVEIGDVRFSGEYVDCVVPRTRTVGVYNRNISFEAVNTNRCSTSGWNVSYFVSADTVPPGSDLLQSAQIIVPQQVINSEELFRENVKQRLESTITDYKLGMFSAFGFAVLMLMLYLNNKFLYPVYMMRVKDTEKPWEKRRRKRKN